MARLIDCSIEKVVRCTVALTWRGKIRIDLQRGWRRQRYEEEDITSITPIDEDKYRSAGGAAAGAIIGGVLTGGIGFLVGAALGGRRRQRSTYLVKFGDGNHVAFEEKSGSVVKAIDRKLESAKIRSLAAPDHSES